MRWADALNESSIGQAERTPANYEEPNIILWDPKFPKAPKLFRANEDGIYAWRRIPLKTADQFDDWIPIQPKTH